jgi:hypothetical protein
VEGACWIFERCILARLRHRRFFGVADLNAAIDILLEDSNNRVMRHAGKSGSCSRRSNAPRWRLCRRSRFEYAEWKNAKVRYERERLEAACERALAINAISYSSVSAILKSGLDRKSPAAEPVQATASLANIRGGTYYQ